MIHDPFDHDDNQGEQPNRPQAIMILIMVLLAVALLVVVWMFAPQLHH